MPYDEALAGRLRERFSTQPGATERKMFGGIAYMVNGNMCCGVAREDLMVRVGPDGHEEALAQPHVRPMGFTNRPMKGMVYVAKDGYAAEADLDAWIQRGLEFVLSLPASNAATGRCFGNPREWRTQRLSEKQRQRHFFIRAISSVRAELVEVRAEL